MPRVGARGGEVTLDNWSERPVDVGLGRRGHQAAGASCWMISMKRG